MITLRVFLSETLSALTTSASLYLTSFNVNSIFDYIFSLLDVFAVHGVQILQAFQ